MNPHFVVLEGINACPDTLDALFLEIEIVNFINYL